MPITPTEQKWRKEFDKKFCILRYGQDVEGYANLGLLNEVACERLKAMHPTKPKPIPPTHDEIKDFISSLLLSQKQELSKEVENREIKWKYKKGEC